MVIILFLFFRIPAVMFSSITRRLAVVTHTEVHVSLSSHVFLSPLLKKPLRTSVVHTMPFRSKEPETNLGSRQCMLGIFQASKGQSWNCLPGQNECKREMGLSKVGKPFSSLWEARPADRIWVAFHSKKAKPTKQNKNRNHTGRTDILWLSESDIRVVRLGIYNARQQKRGSNSFGIEGEVWTFQIILRC